MPQPEENSLVTKSISIILFVKEVLNHFTKSFHINRLHFREFLTDGAESEVAPPRPELPELVCQTDLLRTGGFLHLGIQNES